MNPCAHQNCPLTSANRTGGFCLDHFKQLGPGPTSDKPVPEVWCGLPSEPCRYKDTPLEPKK